MIGKKTSEPSPWQLHLDFFTKLIGEVQIVNVSFDPNFEGVKVHEVLKGQKVATLAWSHDFGLGDFTYDLAGIGGTLSIRQQNNYVFIPWGAVAAIFDPADRENKRGALVVQEVVVEPLKVVATDPPTGTSETVLNEGA